MFYKTKYVWYIGIGYTNDNHGNEKLFHLFIKFGKLEKKLLKCQNRQNKKYNIFPYIWNISL